MKKRNQITQQKRNDAFYNANYVLTIPLYQTEDGETTDIEVALKTPLGVPIQIGYSKSTEPMKIHTHKITFNPSNPEARLLALECRVAMNNAVEPTIYMDKLDGQKYVNDSLNAFENNFNETLKKVTHE